MYFLAATNIIDMQVFKSDKNTVYRFPSLEEICSRVRAEEEQRRLEYYSDLAGRVSAAIYTAIKLNKTQIKVNLSSADWNPAYDVDDADTVWAWLMCRLVKDLTDSGYSVSRPPSSLNNPYVIFVELSYQSKPRV